MMTPSIGLAAIEDENFPGLTDLSGFSFVNFEFHPHHSNTPEEKTFLHAYGDSKKSIYACKDGEGIYYSDGNIKTFGDVSVFAP